MKGSLEFSVISMLIIVIQLSHVHSKENNFFQKALNLHTKLRSRHAAQPLVLSNKLNDIASQCADYYVSQKKIDYSCPFVNRTLGNENLFINFTADENVNPEKFAKAAINAWYGEASLYNFYNPVSSNQTREFTQLVWVNSTKLGFAIERKGEIAVAVALYNPPGNIEGKFKENVLPSK